VTTCIAAAVGAVTVVHEDMHQRACEKQQERQGADDVGPVLACEEVCCDGTHDKQAHGVA
jgi:hypothetical protein